MKPLLLRAEQPPDDAIVVVRGGQMQTDYVRRTAQDSFDEAGIFAVSVFLALDERPPELCRAEPFLARYGQVRLSTVARVHKAGFALIPTLDRPHYDIVLPDLDAETLDRLDAAFDAPIPNPGRKLQAP